jgi:hypothetical protein
MVINHGALSIVEMGIRERWSELFLAGLGQVAANKRGAAHLVTEVVTGDKQTDTQAGKNYKRHAVSPVILFSYQSYRRDSNLLEQSPICLINQ